MNAEEKIENRTEASKDYSLNELDIENQPHLDTSLKLDQEKIASTTWNPSTKRGPSTPLASSKQNQGRRRLVDDSKQSIRLLDFGKFNNEDYIELNYQNWMLNQRLRRSEELIKFMDLERKFSMEEGMKL